MVLGMFSDENLVKAATLSGGAWAPALPLVNLKDDSRFVGKPARQVEPANLAATQFEAVLEYPQAVSLIGVLFHTMSLSARYRLTVAGIGGSLAAPAYQSEWTPVYGRLYSSELLPWEAPNWWTGQAREQDLDLYRRHLWIRTPIAIIASAVRIEFDDSDTEAAFYDIGGLWIAAGWSPKFNFDRGREVGLDPRDLVEEGPSGRLFAESRAGRRRLSLSYSNLDADEVYRLQDAVARVGLARPVLFVPDIEDETGMIREAFPATFAAGFTGKFTWDGLNQAPLALKEIIA